MGGSFLLSDVRNQGYFPWKSSVTRTTPISHGKGVPCNRTFTKLVKPVSPGVVVVVVGGYLGKFLLDMCRWPLRAPTPL